MKTAKKANPLGLTKKEALDILLQNVAESKKQIAQGHYYTHEEVWAEIELSRKKPLV